VCSTSGIIIIIIRRRRRRRKEKEEKACDKRHPYRIIIITIIFLSQCMKREMSQCCGIKQYTQTEKLRQIGQI